MVVPFLPFPRSGDGTVPDFARLTLTDYGRTVALGDYEAAANAMLLELDPEYRRKLKQQRRQTEKSFGASHDPAEEAEAIEAEQFRTTLRKGNRPAGATDRDRQAGRETLAVIAVGSGSRRKRIEDYRLAESEVENDWRTQRNCSGGRRSSS